MTKTVRGLVERIFESFEGEDSSGDITVYSVTGEDTTGCAWTEESYYGRVGSHFTTGEAVLHIHEVSDTLGLARRHGFPNSSTPAK